MICVAGKEDRLEYEALLDDEHLSLALKGANNHLSKVVISISFNLLQISSMH